jgi:hypothetical protein
MRTRKFLSSLKLAGLLLLLGSTGAVQAKTIDLGQVGPGNQMFVDLVPLGSFTDYIQFDLGDTFQVSSFIRSFDFSLEGFDLVKINDFSASLQRAEGGGFTTLASFSGSPMSFDDILGPGSYRIALNGMSSGLFGGFYLGSLQVAAVPEADVWIMLLVGFAVVLHQLRRKQRSLALQPLAA